MPTTHDNIYSDNIIDNIVETMRSEFGNTIQVFFSDSFVKKSNKNLRLSIINQIFKESNKDKFLNNYTIQLKFSSILGRIGKESYKSFFYDIHRIEQSLLSLKGIMNFLDFSIDSISLNDYDDEEENVAGLYNATFIISFSLLKG
tara:strand:+ start:6323 stop:6757 length:435 start_codon:yes stop_codon:yes gene_type:complete